MSLANQLAQTLIKGATYAVGAKAGREIYDTAVVPGVACGMSLGLGAGELATFVTTEELAG